MSGIQLDVGTLLVGGGAALAPVPIFLLTLLLARGLPAILYRPQLVEGEIVQMAAMGSRHFACVARLNAQLTGRLGQAVIVAIQGPVRLMDSSEPDVAILEPREDFYARDLPTPENVLLLVEDSDTTLQYDREVRLPLYAHAGVTETWRS